MRQAKFHTIIFGEEVPEIGSQFEIPDCLIAVQLNESGSEVELLFTDGNGKVVRNNPRIQTFNSVEEANASVRKADRFIGKNVLIKKTHTREVPKIDESTGEQAVDESGAKLTTTESKDVYAEYWWENGIEDENLLAKTLSLRQIINKDSRLPNETPITFEESEDLIFKSTKYTEGHKKSPNYIHSLGTVNGRNLLFAQMWESYKGNKKFMDNIIFNSSGFIKYKGEIPFFGNIAIGRATLENIREGSGTTALGGSALYEFEGVDPKEPYAEWGEWGKYVGNIAIGYWAGRGIKNGGGNVLIGSQASPFTSSGKGEVWNTLIIHNDHHYTGAIHNYKEEGIINGKIGTPLIYGKFRKHWLEIGGKLRLRPQYNREHAKEGDNYEDKFFLVYSDDNKKTGEVHAVNKIEFIKDILLSDAFTLTEEEQTTLKQKLGINV